MPLALENYSIAMVTSVHKRRFDCQPYQVDMAATTSETNSSRYPSEKSVKEALDMLKPPGILSKVGFTIFCNIIEHYCHFIQRILSIRILQIIPRVSASNRSLLFFRLTTSFSSNDTRYVFSVLCTQFTYCVPCFSDVK